MPTETADIVVIYDSKPAFDALAAAFAGYFIFHECPLADYTVDCCLDSAVSVFCVNTSEDPNFELVKNAIKTAQGEKLFVLPTHNSEGVARLRQYSEAEYFLLPLDAEEFRGAVKAALNRKAEKAWSALEPVKQKALTSAVASFGKCFDQVAHGGRSPWTTSRIVASTSARLLNWEDLIIGSPPSTNTMTIHSATACSSAGL